MALLQFSLSDYSLSSVFRSSAVPSCSFSSSLTLRTVPRRNFCGQRFVAGRNAGKIWKVLATAEPFGKMNFNEYLVTLEKPLGIRFALSLDGKILVHSLKKGVIDHLSLMHCSDFCVCVCV